MSRTEDYPAAHSMDTTWFAVDRDGHVAVFDSGEPGAVPDGVLTVEHTPPAPTWLEQTWARVRGLPPPTPPPDPIAEIRRLPDLGAPKLQPSGLLPPGAVPGAPPTKHRGFTLVHESPEDVVAVAVFAREPEMPDAIRALPGLSIESVGPWIAVAFAPHGLALGDPRVAAWSEWMERCFEDPQFLTSTEELDGTGMATRRGLYVYRAHERLYIAEAYGRLLDPARAIRLDDLPPPLARALERGPRFDLSFAATPYLQPIEHVPCSLWWNGGYLASDGVTLRPVPGHEEQFQPEEVQADDPRFEPLKVQR